ncbi:MAG TPA: hypothetical protein VFD01_22215 [Candidatus Dormibacteraeota bacterium]|nr:hypothetical protein [Candidatus Dormibacteraeota bacterium]
MAKGPGEGTEGLREPPDRDDRWDAIVEQSFPASDPPPWAGSVGGPSD